MSDLDYIVSPDLKKTYDTRQVLARLLDGSKFQEYKKNMLITLKINTFNSLLYHMAILGIFLYQT